jgi:hypothetical protein
MNLPNHQQEGLYVDPCFSSPIHFGNPFLP